MVNRHHWNWLCIFLYGMRKLELVIYFFHCLYLMLWLVVATLLFFLLLLAQKFFPLVTNRDQMNWPGAIFLDSIYLVFPFESHHRFNPRLYYTQSLRVVSPIEQQTICCAHHTIQNFVFFSLLSNISVFNEEPQLVDRSLDGVLTKKSIFGTWTPTTDFFSTFEKL